MPAISLLTCELCEKPFLRALTGTPARHCSKRCRNRAYYLSKRGPLESPQPVRKGPRSRANQKDRSEYYHEYNRRPEVMERQRVRNRAEYVPHPRPRKPKYDTNVPVSSPYTGHKWLEMAREAVSSDFNPLGGEWTDQKYDEMGEALLALLEGRDPKEAVRDYRRSEFVPRHLSVHIGDWKGEDGEDVERWGSLLPSTPSAEDEAVARETVRFRYHHGENPPVGRRRNRQQQPSRRRMKDAGWRKHEKAPVSAGA